MSAGRPAKTSEVQAREIAAMASSKTQAADYRIAPQDLLEITLYREPDLGRTIRVDQTGRVNLPLVETVILGDLTVREAENRLQNAYAEFLISPQVNVFIKEYHRKQVFILGEVSKPGPYDFPSEKGLSVLEALALAGGFTKIASQDKTRVVRTMDGKPTDIVVPAASIMRQGDRGQDVPLEPGDIIYVPQSFF